MLSYARLEVVFIQLMVTGLSCFVNVAHDVSQSLQGTATMSEAHFPNQPWTAAKVVDGNINQTATGSSCAITEFAYTSVWLKVQLGNRFNVAYIQIFFRDEQTLYRMSGFSIYAFYDDTFDPQSPSPDDLVYHHDPMSECPAPIQNITINRLVRQIVFTNQRPLGFQSACSGQKSNLLTSIEICEINVMGCNPDRYYPGCMPVCPNKCKNQHCDAFNGSCADGCTDPNALTAECIVCENGQYISNRQCVSCKGHCKMGTYCDKLTGRCNEGCDTQWTGDFCERCIDHYYGDDCNIQCGHCKDNAVCNNVNGHCPSICKKHWTGDRCDECADNYYNANCTGECGHCLNGQVCNKIDGRCSNGCNLHFNPPLCQGCIDHYYGDDCNIQCGHCKDNAVCNNVNGHCPSGCQNHWTGDRCDECADNYYNANCTGECGHCLNGQVCDKINGHCSNGCNLHFNPPLCQGCIDHYYGDDCNIQCGHCKDNAVCNNVNGHCPSGCQNHWTGDRCDECADNYYNANCTGECGHCLNGQVCDKINGHCSNGCNLHFNPPLCQECADNYYNANCTGECGHCLNGQVCNKINGHCSNGCNLHFNPPLCQECDDGFYNRLCTGVCGNCKNGAYCEKDNGYCPNGCINNFKYPFCKECIDGFYNDTCTAQCGHCKGTKTCDKDNGTCISGCEPSFKYPMCQESMESEHRTSNSNTGAIAGGIVSALIVLVIVGILGVFYRRRRGSNNSDGQGKDQSTKQTFHSKYSGKGKKYADLNADLPETSPAEYMNETLMADDGGYYNTAEFNTAIRIEDLQRVVSEKSAGENNTFQSEYKRLPVGNTSLCKEGKKQENLTKNRFKTTFPYDHSRVILKETWNDGDMDYINANFIKDFHGHRFYIAAQGPKNNTLSDFWRMIWQANVRFIVNLTNIIENGKNKCTQYWPAKDKILEVGPCKMQLLKENVYAFHTYRKFTAQSTNSSGKRTITQFHYTAWPDHGTPEELGLVQFHKAVTKSYQPGGLMLVHCSAGVGRTGTFIGLDSLLKQGRETGKINVLEFVKQMREDRMTMVQTKDQYIFLHKALLFGFQDKNTVIRESDIPTRLQTLLQDSSPLNLRALYKEYKFLQTVKPVFEDDDKEDRMKPENKDKNSNMNVIPVSKYRPYLTSYVKGRNDYINAVCVPSFSSLGAFILTQAPLPDTKVDLWTLCMDHDVKAIVILTENNEEIQWIPKKGCSCICAPYTLTSGDTGSSISGVTQDTLSILNDGTKQGVDVFHIPFENDNAMIKGVELLLEKGKEDDFTSVVISKDGSGPTGIFCALHNALQQLRMDGEVDILTTVRLIQTRRPELINNLEEYKRCHELLLLTVLDDGIYANM